jgi:hypothetical protein
MYDPISLFTWLLVRALLFVALAAVVRWLGEAVSFVAA